MSITYQYRSYRRHWIGHALCLVLWLHSMSTAQMQTASPSSLLNDRSSPDEWVGTRSVGQLKPYPPFDTSANLMITGNVTGGKQFHATIPYTSTSDFQESLQSTYLDSFLRLTQDSDLTTVRPPVYSPFYSPTATVTHTRLGQPSVVTSSGLTAMPLGNSVSPAEKTRATHLLSIDQIQDHSDDTALVKIEPTIIPDASVKTSDTSFLQPWQMPFLDSEALLSHSKLPDRLSDQEQDTTADTAKPTSQPDQSQDTAIFSEPTVNPTVDAGNDSLPDSETVDSNSIPTSMITPDILQDIKNSQSLLNNLGSLKRTTTDSSISEESFISDANAPSSLLTTGALPANVSLHAFREAKYDTFIKTGEAYLRQGQFQLAENAYTLAGVYRHDDAEAWAGRSLALLAKEEYASSALFLKRALNIVPDYAKVRIDLPSLIGGIQAVRQHVKRLKAYQDNRRTPDLQILLTYVYLQMNDLGLAQGVLDKAVRSHPNDLTLKALQAAVTEKMEY